VEVCANGTTIFRITSHFQVPPCLLVPSSIFKGALGVALNLRNMGCLVEVVFGHEHTIFIRGNSTHNVRFASWNFYTQGVVMDC
jgi:hypothetical protein